MKELPMTRRVPRTLREGAPEGAIALRIGEDGRPFADPYYAHVPFDTPLRWHFHGPWTVRFLDHRTPVQDGDGNDVYEIHGDRSGQAAEYFPSKEGHFRYALAAAGAEDGGRGEFRIYLDATCPEIIVP